MSHLAILASWADARLADLSTPTLLARRRRRLWEAMRPILARTPALRRHASAMPADIEPIAPATMRGDFAAWNSAGVPHEEAMLAALDAETGGSGRVRDGIVAGLSTGTSGTRGLFLVSAAERARYVGQSVARLLPASAPFTGARIALILRADSDLYRDAGKGRFAFLHLPLGLDARDMADALDAFRPSVVVAPPRELAALASSGRRLPHHTMRLLWGSEPMAPHERDAIRSALGLRPDPIYQATEGFIAVACPHGTLHLNDDTMIIDLEKVAGTDAFRPIVTDLRRHVQPMVRVRMDDLVRQTTCSCGSPRRAVEPVLGRVGDLWTVGGRILTPDAVDDHFAGSLPPHARWRVEGGADHVRAWVSSRDDVDAMRRAATALHPAARVTVETGPDATTPKRRRVTWEKTA